MQYDNPAARLEAILAAGLQIRKETVCLEAWQEILAVPGCDADCLLVLLGRVMELPARVMQSLAAHFPDQPASSAGWHGPVRAAFISQQLNGRWESFISHIDAHCVAQLEMTAKLLHSRLGRLLPDEEDLAGLSEDISSLAAEISRAALPEGLKQHLTHEMEDLVRTLKECRIVGGRAALRQAEAMVGHAHIDTGYFAFLTDHPLGQQVFDSLNAVAAVLAA